MKRRTRQRRHMHREVLSNEGMQLSNEGMQLSNEGMFSNPLNLLENPILFENPLSQGAKVAIGVGVVAAVGVIAYILLSSKTASAAQQPAPKCPDGSLPPGGNLTNCPSPKLGNNDPDAPPGGWAYNGSVSSNVQQAATALAAVDPCQKSSEQLVRNFEAAAGMTITGGTGDPNAVTPPGTDGRYGGDVAAALAQYVSNPPQACYSNANPNSRPSWWGSPGTYTNP